VGTVPAGAAKASGGDAHSFLHQLNGGVQISSTVPTNGDVNPYGVAVVPTTRGRLVAGDILVSNFNSKANVQGTGSTIVEVSPTGGQQLFAQVSRLTVGRQCPGGIGLSTALSVLPGGWVVVGSLPTGVNGALPKGDPAGCLIVLNSEGVVAETISTPEIVGPWDMVAETTGAGADLFVSNALGGDIRTSKGIPVAGSCTVVRLDLAYSPKSPPTLLRQTIIGKGFPWQANKAALVLAPTGLALSFEGTLYVDNSLNNTVTAITNATKRSKAVVAGAHIVAKGGGLNAPLGMVITSSGDLIVVNGNNGVATELGPSGKQVATKTLIKNGAGDLFGIALTPNGQGLYFVNDGTNALELAQLG
jgi:hypothetical protein